MIDGRLKLTGELHGTASVRNLEPIPAEGEDDLSISRNNIAQRGHLEVYANEVDIKELLFGERKLKCVVHKAGVMSSSDVWKSVLFTPNRDVEVGAELPKRYHPAFCKIG